MEKHINIVAALQIGLGIFSLISAFFIATILNMVGMLVDECPGSSILFLISNILTVLFIVIAAPGIITGIGLYKRKRWARTICIILSVLEAFSFPFGTIIGIYSIWALSNSEMEYYFKENNS